MTRKLLLALAVILAALSWFSGCSAPTEPPPLPTSPPPTKTDTPPPPTATPFPLTLEPGKEPLVLAAVSMNAAMDTEKNRETMALYMEQARAEGAHLVAFPVFALQSNPCYGFAEFDPSDEARAYFQETAEMIPGPSTDWLVEKASEVGIYCVFGMIEVGDDGNLYDSAVFLGPDGVIGVHRHHSFSDSGSLSQFFSAGPAPLTIVESPLGRVGLAIGIEMGESQSGQAEEDAPDFLVSIAVWPTSAGGLYLPICMGHGAMAGLWHAVANHHGEVGEILTYGQSRILNPSGSTAASIGSEEGMAIAQTDVLVDSSLFGSQ